MVLAVVAAAEEVAGMMKKGETLKPVFLLLCCFLII
jgi:hypothetical protein